MFSTSTLSLSEIPSEKLEKWPIASSFDLLKNKQYYVKLQAGIFHLNRHTLGIQLQTKKKKESHNNIAFACF